LPNDEAGADSGIDNDIFDNINKDFIRAVGTAFNFVGPAAICGLLAAALIFCFLVPGSAAVVYPAATTNYTLRAMNPAGSVVASVQVSVAERIRPPVINYFA
jgi:hypothetical protein